MNKYKVRKLLTMLVILSIILGPIAFFKIEEAIKIRPWVRMARVIEEYDSHLDVVNIMPGLNDSSRLDIILQLDTPGYWYERRWKNFLQYLFPLVRDAGYNKVGVLSGWETGKITKISNCKELRFGSCRIEEFPPETLRSDLFPWVGKGKP